MAQITEKESEILRVLLKDIMSYHNANSISKIAGMSRIGAMKILKKFRKTGVLIDKRIGKAVIYKVNLGNDYSKKLMAFLLADEADKYRRWMDEFKGLFRGDRIVILFGSTIRNYEHARDIDLMVILKKKDEMNVDEILKERQAILPKRLHAIKLTSNDFLDSVKKKNKPTIDIIKNSIILYGQDKYVEIIKDVTSF